MSKNEKQEGNDGLLEDDTSKATGANDPSLQDINTCAQHNDVTTGDNHSSFSRSDTDNRQSTHDNTTPPTDDHMTIDDDHMTVDDDGDDVWSGESDTNQTSNALQLLAQSYT